MGTKIETLKGAIDSSELGVMYIHEHLLTNPPVSRMELDPDYKLDSADRMVEELLLFHAAGGRSIMDCSALDYGRDVKGMCEIADRVPVNILALTGFNRGDYEPWVRDGSEELFYDMMLRDIVDGMDGTDCKAAVVKIGTCYNYILDSERRIMSAAARVHKKTGKPIITHTTLGTMGLEQVSCLSQGGVDPHFIALSHLDQNLDFYYLSQIAKAGAFIEFDGPSKVKYATDERRIEMLSRLCDAGYEDQILISGDMGRKSYLTAYGGGPGFGFLLGKFVPRLLEQGFTQALVDKFFISNPVRFLSANQEAAV